jgi:hypothetical protein
LSIANKHKNAQNITAETEERIGIKVHSNPVSHSLLSSFSRSKLQLSKDGRSLPIYLNIEKTNNT